MPLNIAVFVSGRGSNLEAILAAIKEGKLDARVLTVISNKPDVGALAIAEAYDVESKVIPSAGISRADHEKLICQYLESFKLDYLVLAGYMRVLTPYLLDRFKDSDGTSRIINIHPSLLPSFPGVDGYKDAFDYGVKVAGITIHLVSEKLDDGPILAQEAFARLPDDTLEDFKARGFAVEHRLYPKTLQALAQSKSRLLTKAGELS